MSSRFEAVTVPGASCEIRTDALVRQLYATDASIYQVVPEAVAFPKSAEETAAAMGSAMEQGWPIIPRGAGTGLAGGALGPGLVIDLSRHNRGISEFNPEARTVRVQAGVVLDQLNAFLEPHGLTFGPDVATSSRATLGGMIANNSSGARAPIYGTTIDHVQSLQVVLPDGRIADMGPQQEALKRELAAVDELILAHAPQIRERFHEHIVKRWPGYGLDRYLRAREPGGDGAIDVTKLLAGSEGTLATVFSAELSLVPPPKEKGVGLVFFATVEQAMQATVELLDLSPAGVEHIDDVLFDQTRGQLPFQMARDLLELDTKPCKSILLIEFYEDEHDKLAALERKNLGLRTYICKNAGEMAHVWNLRKAGLSLLTGCKGAPKPVAGLEDVAVPPESLPEYVRGMHGLMDSLGFKGSYYGHAASGLLHIRPVVNLRQADDIARFRSLANGVSELALRFKGSLTAEHGVGMARTEFMEAHIGPELLGVMRAVKQSFDPQNRMNPGKIFDDGSYRIDTHLRQGAGTDIELPFEPVLAFAAKDESLAANLDQCNGCGGCRKDAVTMCPTFLATGEEVMSTRGRANTIRAALEGRLSGGEAVLSEDLEQVLSNCLACKACATECPSNVNLALMKAELLHARWQRTGAPLVARVVSRVDLLGTLGSMAPRLTNAMLRQPIVRQLMQRTLGLSARRPLPPYALDRFDAWFHRRRKERGAVTGARGRVILWDDCFVRHNEPEIGQAAVQVLEAAGFEVTVPVGRACCGRPAFSMGRLDVASRFGRYNAQRLCGGSEPIVFLEPSCFSMFKEDYKELKIPGAEELSERAVLFEPFVEQALADAPDILAFDDASYTTAIHVHCHAKALTEASISKRLAERIPNNQVDLLESGCCGMAGAFGALKDKYELSLKVAEPLVEMVRALPEDTRLVASGTSCRHQIGHLTEVAPLHAAQLLAEALVTE